MNIARKFIVGIALFFMTIGVLNATEKNSLMLNLSSSDVEANIILESGLSKNSNVRYEFGGMRAVDGNDNKNTLLFAGVENVGLTDLKGIIFGLGVNIHTSNNTQNDDITSALAAKVRVGYILPLKIKTTVAGALSYAPESLTLSDNIDKYSDFRLTAEAEVIDGGNVVAGYRDITYGVKNGDDYTFNKTVFIGFKLLF